MRNVVITDKYIYIPNNGTKSTTIIPRPVVPNGDVDMLLKNFVPGGVVMLNNTDGVRVVRNKSIKKYE